MGGRCGPIHHMYPAPPTHLPAPRPAEERAENETEEEEEDEEEGDDDVQKRRMGDSS